jgi:hypothetical protein
MYLGKDSENTTQTVTATHATVRSLTRIVEGVGHKLLMDSFSFPYLFDDLHTDCQSRHKGMRGGL